MIAWTLASLGSCWCRGADNKVRKGADFDVVRLIVYNSRKGLGPFLLEAWQAHSNTELCRHPGRFGAVGSPRPKLSHTLKYSADVQSMVLIATWAP